MLCLILVRVSISFKTTCHTSCLTSRKKNFKGRKCCSKKISWKLLFTTFSSATTCFLNYYNILFPQFLTFFSKFSLKKVKSILGVLCSYGNKSQGFCWFKCILDGFFHPFSIANFKFPRQFDFRIFIRFHSRNFLFKIYKKGYATFATVSSRDILSL